MNTLMRCNFRPLFGVVALGAVLIAAVEAGAAEVKYHLIKEIPVGVEGGWDYLSVDAGARRLYVSHATKVVVIDLDKNEVVGEVTDTPGVHGFAVAPELQRGFASNGQESKASIVDLKTLKTLSKVSTGANPDAILYEPGHKEVYTFNGRGNSATVFDADSGKVVATIPLNGKPEFAQTDTQAGRVYVNIEDKNEVAVIDTKTHTVVNTWPIAPGEESSGMAIDVPNHRLFIVCGNKFMVMMDNIRGKVIATIPIGDGADAAAFDPETKLAFSSNGEGNVTIADAATPGELKVVQTLTTERGARTMTLDPKTHRIYLSSAKFEAVPKQAAGAPRRRPRAIAGSFKVLVYGP